MNYTRQEYLYSAKIAQQTQRFQEMASAMKKLVVLDSVLSFQDRYLLNSGFKNLVGKRRVSWRAISSLQKKQQKKNHLDLLQKNKKHIKEELYNYCKQILDLLDDYLLKNVSDIESKVYYLTLKGRYNRYIAETCTGEEKKEVADASRLAYEEATELAVEHLETTHPTRFGLHSEFSIFYYEIMEDPNGAIKIASKALNEFYADCDKIKQEHYKDSTTVLSLFRDNHTLWRSQLQQEGQN